MEYLKVKNWSKFQHYKHRSPPWIKLHRSLLADYAFSCLHDASKAHLILIWLHASEHDGAVPADPSRLRRCLGLKSNPDLKVLIEQGFLIPDASTTLAPRLHDADSEKSRVEKEGGNARQALKAMLKKGKKREEQNPAETEKNRRIAQLLAEGKEEEARQLRAQTP